MFVRTFRNLPVGTDYNTFREAVRRQLALCVQSRSSARPGGPPARREIELTERNQSLRDVWEIFNARRPQPQDAYVRVVFDTEGDRVESVTFSADHLRREGPGVPPPHRGERVRAQMRQFMRDLGLRSGSGSFAYWFCQQYALDMPDIPRDRNPPMIEVHPISGLITHGGVVYGSPAFAQLSGWWWDEMQEYHQRPPARIDQTHFIGRQKGGLQDAINFWGRYFLPRVRSIQGEAVFNFQGRSEWGIFRRVMNTCPPEVQVPRFMIGQGPRPIRSCARWTVTDTIPSNPPRHSNTLYSAGGCPNCPAGRGLSLPSSVPAEVDG